LTLPLDGSRCFGRPRYSTHNQSIFFDFVGVRATISTATLLPSKPSRISMPVVARSRVKKLVGKVSAQTPRQEKKEGGSRPESALVRWATALRLPSLMAALQSVLAGAAATKVQLNFDETLLTQPMWLYFLLFGHGPKAESVPRV
jgi:hypothetical protein